MNRKYDTEYFKNKIIEIRNIRPDISITTDVIVGHPYETDEYFQETYDFCKEINFSKIHVFPYSVRTGTVASKMPYQVDDATKKIRAGRLIELSKYTTPQISES
jgi:threonylcarbamoyladenosine tRNA methylthiotransferase MtaB